MRNIIPFILVLVTAMGSIPVQEAAARAAVTAAGAVAAAAKAWGHANTS